MENENKIEMVKAILRKHGIWMSVWAMEDLDFAFEYKGEMIIGDPVIGEEIDFNMFYD